MKKTNLLKFKKDGIDITNLDSVSKAIEMYEALPFYKTKITKTKMELDAEKLICKLKSDGKISKMSEYCFRILPIGLRIKMLHEEMDFRASFVSVLYSDIDESLIYYYDDKRNQSKMIMNEYSELKNSPDGGKYPETHLDTLRKQKIKLMRKTNK